MKNVNNAGESPSLSHGPFALCRFYKDGSVFPCRINIASASEAARARAWQLVGAGQFEDWRVVPMRYLSGVTLSIDCFTKDYQEEIISAIAKATK